VDHGLDVNSTTQDGTSAFHWACWQGHLEVCKWLVYSAGCDFGHTNEFGCNAIQWVAQTDNLDICRWLSAIGLDLSILNRNGHSALHKAASKGQARVCEWLLNEECLGLQHLRPDQDGNTPAAIARMEGYAELAEALDAAVANLERGCVLGTEGPFSSRSRMDNPSLSTDTSPLLGPGPSQLNDLLSRPSRPQSIRKGSGDWNRGVCVRIARLKQQKVCL
jgi:ankyrin repeat protein